MSDASGCKQRKSSSSVMLLAHTSKTCKTLAANLTYEHMMTSKQQLVISPEAWMSGGLALSYVTHHSHSTKMRGEKVTGEMVIKAVTSWQEVHTFSMKLPAIPDKPDQTCFHVNVCMFVSDLMCLVCKHCLWRTKSIPLKTNVLQEKNINTADRMA